jgi:hypothetical protein
MMKMMEQCTAMMRSVHRDGGGAKDDREQKSRGSMGVKPLHW